MAQLKTVALADGGVDRVLLAHKQLGIRAALGSADLYEHTLHQLLDALMSQ